MNKICFIGKNGTGKTTLLKCLVDSLKDPTPHQHLFNVQNQRMGISLGFTFDNNEYYVFYKEVRRGAIIGPHSFFIEKASISDVSITSLLKLSPEKINEQISRYSIYEPKLSELKKSIQPQNNSNRLLIFSPSESDIHNNKILSTHLLPDATLNTALRYFKEFPFHHIISSETINDFWNLVIYQVKKRESDREEFENREENLNKTKKQLTEEFEKNNPDFLKVLSEKWNIILEKTGLYFDYNEAKKPIQLNDNLIAYIKIKSTQQPIQYYLLSSGTRHLIFRMGYLLSLFYKRDVHSAIALFDEVENSLFPDVLYNIIEEYVGVTKNTQFFFATHSPIVAAQFEPCERIILDFNEEGKIVARKGIAPTGDDPNDVLWQDFGVQNLMGKEGIKKWERFLELKMAINKEVDKEKKKKLEEEYLQLGNAYKF